MTPWPYCMHGLVGGPYFVGGNERVVISVSPLQGLHCKPGVNAKVPLPTITPLLAACEAAVGSEATIAWIYLLYFMVAGCLIIHLLYCFVTFQQSDLQVDCCPPRSDGDNRDEEEVHNGDAVPECVVGGRHALGALGVSGEGLALAADLRVTIMPHLPSCPPVRYVHHSFY